MSLTTANSGPILSPEQIGELVIKPLSQASVALQVSHIVQVASTLRIPLVASDVSSGWVAEAAEIPATDLATSEIDVVPRKLAALTAISNELANDSSPAAQAIVGQSIVRDLQRKLDGAYFGNTAANTPDGLLSITPNAVNGGVVANGYTNLDWAESAKTNAEQHNTQITAFVCSPATALALSTIKEYSAAQSNRHLLGADPTLPGQRIVSGVPLLTSPAVSGSTIWAIPRERSIVAMRQDASLVPDSSVFFTSDRTAVRATIRLSWAFTDPAAFSKITLT